MKKKFQVFISSTYIDLIDERNAAVEAILKAGHIPAGMELFKSGRSQLETIKSWIDQSDIYLLILGKRYGSIDSESGKSYTQLEYEYALSKQNFPIFSIVLKDEYVESKVGEENPRENLFEIDNPDEFNDFLDLVKTRIVSFAGSIAEVKLAVHENIPEIENTYELDGWIRASLGDNNEILQKVKNLNLTSFNKDPSEDRFIDIEVEINKEITVSGKHTITKGNGYQRYEQNTNKTVEINYKTIFCEVAPHLLSHPNDTSTKLKISEILVSLTDIPETGTFRISDSDFQKIKVHFLKLGLIHINYNKTTQGGMALFWSISKMGHSKMLEWKET